MRYIGAVYQQVAEKELNHLKTLIEREAVLRSVKHLFNEQLREAPDTHISAVLAHLFNLLLSPLPLIEKLDSGCISYPISASTVSSTQASDKTDSKSAENLSEDTAPGSGDQSKKKLKKKDKKKTEVSSSSGKQASATTPADLGEMFLKQSGVDI